MSNPKNLLNHIEVEFLKSLSYEEINNIINGFNDKIIILTKENEELKELLSKKNE